MRTTISSGENGHSYIKLYGRAGCSPVLLLYNRFMDKNQTVELKITDMTSDGRGVGRAHGMACFVDGAVAGDTVLARITRVKKSYCLAATETIIKSSPDRREPYCEYMGECGGCPFGLLTDEAENRLKEKHVYDKLVRIAGIEIPKVRHILRAARPFNYRNKAVMSVDESGRVGFIARAGSRVIDCKTCALQAPSVEVCAEALRTFIACENIGCIKRMTVKTAFATGEVMVILEISGKGIPGWEKFVMMIDDALTGDYSLESVTLVDGNGRCRVLAGRRTITDELCGLKFEISPLSFYQVNHDMTEKLYETALRYAGLTGAETILDLYCGIGTIGLSAARSGAAKVIGVESAKEAVIAANRNAVINGTANAVYECGMAETVVPELISDGIKPDVVILDPPRRGCDAALIDSVAKATPKRIVYVSCDPATLARDVRKFIDNKYEFIEATPVQMFLHTGHIEVVTLLTRTAKQ